VIVIFICVGIPVASGVIYRLARRWRRTLSTPIPPFQLPSGLQEQELDRLAFQHRIRTRAILDRAHHDIHTAASEHRNKR
jgi:hypothetical protein